MGEGRMERCESFYLRELACHVPVTVPGSGALLCVSKVFRSNRFANILRLPILSQGLAGRGC